MLSELEDAADDAQRFERALMDMQGNAFEGRYTDSEPVRPPQSSLQDNIDRCMQQLDRLEKNVARLDDRTQLVQSKGPTNTIGGPSPKDEPGNSEYANRVGVLWYRLEDINDSLAALVDRLDL